MDRTPATEPSRDARRLSVSEMLLVGLLLVAGGALRVACPGRMAIEHFDEGVYASDWWFEATDDGHYPDRHLYAPPLLPGLIEWLFVFLGPSNGAAMLVSLVAGALTVLLVWWTGRRWFGPAAGVASAALAALSDVHILFSRTVLTDVLHGAWLLLAVALFREAAHRPGWLPVLGAGIVTGLAWLTKYTGWLPLAISLAGIVPWSLVPPGSWRQRSPALVRWMVAAAVAGLIWLPYLWSLQDVGGYASVAANHRGYVVGWEGWPEAFLQQVENLRILSGWPSVLGPAAAFFGVAWLSRSGRGFTWNDDREASSRLVLVAVVLFSLSIWLGTSLLLAVLGGVALLNLLSRAMTSSGGNPEKSLTSLAVWMLAAWFFAMLLMTPLYRPYPRLVLPWVIASWLAAGVGLARLAEVVTGWNVPLRWFPRRAERSAGQAPRVEGAGTQIDAPAALRRRWVLPLSAAALLLAATLFLAGARLMEQGVPGWQARTGLARVAERIVQDLGAIAEAGRGPDEAIVYVYAEPALLFQLRLQGLPLVAPVSNLGFAAPQARRLPLPTFLAAGPHALRDPRFQQQLADVGTRLRLLETYDYRPSDLVLLDEAPPEEEQRQPVAEVRLYRVAD